jgi:crotonobetaine/carnitine-CoA ligase
MANRIANGLLELGLKPGDRIALMLPSHPDHIVAILALAKAGFVRVSINVHLIGAALDYPFDKFEPHALIIDEDLVGAGSPGEAYRTVFRNSK